MVWSPRCPSRTFSRPWWPSRPFSHTRLSSISLWIQIEKKVPKKRPKSSWQLRNFSVMFLTENQLFGSSAWSNLQAISLLSFSDTILFVNQKGPRLYVQLQKQSIFFLSSVCFHSFIQFQSDFHMSGNGTRKVSFFFK